MLGVHQQASGPAALLAPIQKVALFFLFAFNFADLGGPMVHPDTKSVVDLVAGGAVR